MRIKITVSLAIALLCYGHAVFARTESDDHYSANVKIIVALITGILGVLTGVFTMVRTNMHAKKMLELQAELDLKKEKDNNRIKFLLTYDTDKVNQYMISLKEFLATSQKLKDEVRDMVAHFDSTLTAERVEQVAGLRKKIIEQYANNVYYFNTTDKDKTAHEIKNQFLEIFSLLESSPPTLKPTVAALIDAISQNQVLLHQAIEVEINKIIDTL